MGRRPHEVLECRHYDLPPHFPILLITGEDWRISDVPSGVLHFHNQIEIGLCESDSGCLSLQSTSHRFHAGDVTFISGDVAHTTWSDPGTASKWSYLFVDAEELLRPFFPMEALPNAGLFRQLLSGTFAMVRPEEAPRIRALVNAMMDELTNQGLNYEISVRGLFLTFMTEMMRLLSARGTTASPRSMGIGPALNYINEHYMEEFSIGDLADLCGMSQSHFRALFRSAMGIGPLEQVNRTRIQKACSLLRMTDSSVLAISELVGYRTLSSFNRHFSAEMGVSPSEWRRAAGNSRMTPILKYSGWLTPPKQIRDEP